MTTRPTFFCVYRITNIKERKHYYGFKSSSLPPIDVVGVSYFSSLKGESGAAFIKHQQEHPEQYRYKIIRSFDNKKDALALEIKLHNKFNVGRNPNFYNNAKQTSIGFSGTTSGYVYAADAEGNLFFIQKTDPRYKNELVPTFPAKDVTGNVFKIRNDDPRYLSGELVHISCGYKFSAESRQRMSAIGKSRPKEQHSAFGKMWISNDSLKQSRKINKQEPLPVGWYKGRKF